MLCSLLCCESMQVYIKCTRIDLVPKEGILVMRCQLGWFSGRYTNPLAVFSIDKASLFVEVIRACGTAEFGENSSRNMEFLAISRRNDGILCPDRTRIFSRVIGGMRNFYEISRICGFHLLPCRERSWSHLCFSSQLYENNFQALHKNFNCHSPPLSTWIDENV